MILLDTTVLVYAVAFEHALREPCRALISAIGDGRIAATTTVEVLQESTHVRARDASVTTPRSSPPSSRRCCLPSSRSMEPTSLPG